MRAPTLPASRIVRGAIGAELSHQFVDADGNAADPVGTVTVTVTRSDGTTVTGMGAIGGTADDPRTSTLDAAAVATVDWLTAVWAIDAVPVASSTTEIVGGVIINKADATAVDSTLVAQTRFVQARKATEDTLTAELFRSPFQRFYTERIDGTGTCDLIASWPDIIEVVWARVWTSATESTDLTAAQLAAIPADPSGILTRTDGTAWPAGTNNIEVGYRFGMIDLPSDLRDNLVSAIRYHLNKFEGPGAQNFLGSSLEFADDFATRTNRPGVGMSITGNDDVDSAIRRHRFTRYAIA